jgi:hypothetical protein
MGWGDLSILAFILADDQSEGAAEYFDPWARQAKAWYSTFIVEGILACFLHPWL